LGGGSAAELAQTGLVPADAKSIHFYTSGLLGNLLPPDNVLFSLRVVNGLSIPFSPVEVSTNYVHWATDISQFAGKVIEIRFSVAPNRAGSQPPVVFIDNISFSTEPFVPLIARPPTNQIVFVGASAQFTVTLNAPGPYTFQWLFDSKPVAGETNATLRLSNVQFDQAGYYSVIVSNSTGTATSPSATLGVSPIAVWGASLLSPVGISNIQQIAAGAWHGAALRADGTVQTWSDPFEVPVGLSNVVAIAAGYDYTLALKGEGTVVAWGQDEINKQTSVPPGLSNVIAIAAGNYAAAAVISDGTVQAWGGNWNGQASLPPPGLTNVISIALGNSHGAALLKDGTVTVWGSGQTDIPSGLSNIVSIACGDTHTLALRSDHTVYAWGDNSSGQLNVPPGLTNVVAIAAGAVHSLALTSEGFVTSWGSITNVPYGLRGVTKIAAAGSRPVAMALIGSPSQNSTALVPFPRRTTSGFNVSVQSSRSAVYELAYKISLDDPTWKTASLAAGTGGQIVLHDPLAQDAQRFYVVRKW
jgi:hypothetical protein